VHVYSFSICVSSSNEYVNVIENFVLWGKRVFDVGCVPCNVVRIGIFYFHLLYIKYVVGLVLTLVVMQRYVSCDITV
jgi:hypothetical protein